MESKKPEREREDNRKMVLLNLFEKPLTFTELVKKTGLARSTVAQHLKDLQKNKSVRKIIREKDGKPAYRTSFDEAILTSEFRLFQYDLLMALFSQLNPSLFRLLESQLKAMTKMAIYLKKREAEGKPLPLGNLTTKEGLAGFLEKLRKEELSGDSPEVKDLKELVRVSVEVIETIIPLEELERLKAEVSQSMKKKNSGVAP